MAHKPHALSPQCLQGGRRDSQPWPWGPGPKYRNSQEEQARMESHPQDGLTPARRPAFGH